LICYFPFQFLLFLFHSFTFFPHHLTFAHRARSERVRLFLSLGNFAFSE
jgi:hypothetical protein